VLILLFKKGKEISLDWNTVVEDTGIRLRLGERRGRLLKDINGMPVNVFYEIFLQQEKGKGFLNHTFISPSYESVYRKIVYDALFMDEEGLHFAKSVDRVKEMNVGMVSKALHQYLIEKIGPFFESIDQRFMVLYCAGRLASLGEASKKEIEKYKRAIGFLSYGEVVTYNRKALFLNWSCVYLFFESSIHLPPVEPDTTPLELTRRFTELGQILTDLFMKDMVMAVVDMNENLIFYNKMLSFLFDSEEDIKDYLVRWSKSAKEKKKTTSRIHHLQSKSKNFYFRVYSIPYRDFIILTIEDFTKYASLEILERNLRINPITGLPTRHSIQYENKASCFTLDIQNFGSISLYYSEDIANQLLTEVSSILSDYAHSFNLMLYHTGIDEFTLISKDLGPEDIYYAVELSLEEAFRGTVVSIPLVREVACDACGGRGYDPTKGERVCPTCGGRGEVIQRQFFITISQTCPTCGGEGVIREPCPKCRGRGTIPQREEVKVRIPPGVDTGSKIMAEGKGHAGRFGGPPGDLIITVKVKPHPTFERRGNNLYVDAYIKITEAILGTEIEVPTLEGRKVKVKVPAGIQEGETIRVEGYGMPKLMSDGRGDLFVRIHIDIPKLGFFDKFFGDGKRIKQLLEELDKLLPEPERIKEKQT